MTCFADMYYFEDAVAEATAAAGLRALCAQTVLRFPRLTRPAIEESLARARDFIQRWHGHPLIVPGAGAPRAVHLHRRDPARLRGARRASSTSRCTPTCRNGAGSGATRGGARDAGHAVGQEAAACSTPRCWPRTASTWTKGKSAR